MLGLDHLLLSLLSLIASNFEYFADQVLDGSSDEDASTLANAVTVAARAQETGASSGWEDESSFGLPGDSFCLSGGLGSFAGGGLSG